MDVLLDSHSLRQGCGNRGGQRQFGCQQPRCYAGRVTRGLHHQWALQPLVLFRSWQSLRAEIMSFSSLTNIFRRTQMCSWACRMPAHPKCVIFSNRVHWSNKGSDLHLARPRPRSVPAPRASRLCICLRFPALPQRTCQPRSRPCSTSAVTWLPIQFLLQAPGPMGALGSRQTAGKQSLTVAQQSIRQDGCSLDPREPLGEGGSLCNAPSSQGFLPVQALGGGCSP